MFNYFKWLTLVRGNAYVVYKAGVPKTSYKHSFWKWTLGNNFDNPFITIILARCKAVFHDYSFEQHESVGKYSAQQGKTQKDQIIL